MSEKQILKNMLKRLKAKTINSEGELFDSFANLFGQIAEIWNTIKKLTEEKASSDKILELVMFDMNWLHSLSEMSYSYSKKILEDFKLYVESLEQYSSGLDETLNDIFQQAEKMAEEQRKKQEEMKKKKPKYTV